MVCIGAFAALLCKFPSESKTRSPLLRSLAIKTRATLCVHCSGWLKPAAVRINNTATHGLTTRHIIPIPSPPFLYIAPQTLL